RREVRILATKNRIFFLNRSLYFLNQPVPLLSITYDASTTVDVQGRVLTVNKDILMEVSKQGESTKIADLMLQPKKEAEVKSRQLMLHAEDSIRGFLEVREEAFSFLSNLRTNPRKTTLELFSLLGAKQIDDPIDEMTKLYSERLSKSMVNLDLALSEVESQVGKGQTRKLYALLYFAGKLQDVIFEGRDPKKMKVLKDFGLELGFNETFFESLEGKNTDAGLLNVLRNVRLIDLAQSTSQVAN
ncbi:MAG TPA: hypothetical protein VED17_06225, partial [Nitrososphaerales archaeon]|nr:hypothetical protein [Nitrososphaerales archaeon]